MSIRSPYLRDLCTFLASFFAFRCFAADAFSILFRNRTGTRFDLGSADTVSDGSLPAECVHTPDLHCGVSLWICS